jgi:3-hydroxypropanoate dehydrogenase
VGGTVMRIGYGDPAGLLERLPRPDINEVCSFV